MASQPDGPRLPVAYCAPGQRLAATVALWLAGRDFSRVVETPVIEGTDVYLVTEPDPFEPGPVRVLEDPRGERFDLDWDRRYSHRLYGALINRPVTSFGSLI